MEDAFDRSDSLRVSWRMAAISGGIGSVALIVVLIVVAARVEAPALTTTALVLAIVSFVTQILIALFQFAAGSAQQTEWGRLSEELQRQLAEIRSLSGEVRSAQSGEMRRLLDHVLDDVRAGGGTPRDEALAVEVFERIRESQSSPGEPIPVRSHSEETALDALTRWLLDRGIVPERGGWLQADLKWTAPDGRSWVVESKRLYGDRLTPTEFLRAVQTADELRQDGEVEGGEAVLLVETEPEVRGYQKVADERNVRVVWPGVFDDRLADVGDT